MESVFKLKKSNEVKSTYIVFWSINLEDTYVHSYAYIIQFVILSYSYVHNIIKICMYVCIYIRMYVPSCVLVFYLSANYVYFLAILWYQLLLLSKFIFSIPWYQLLFNCYHAVMFITTSLPLKLHFYNHIILCIHTYVCIQMYISEEVLIK